MVLDPGSIALAGAAAVVAGAMALGRARPAIAPLASAASAAIMAGALLGAWLSGAGALVDVRWLGLTGSRFTLALDPLGAPLAVFAAGLAAVVLLFTAGYLPGRLAERKAPAREQARFCGLMLAFMLSMILLLIAQDLLAIFLALELTALLSFLLIQFDREEAGARSAAMLALVITVGSSLLYLCGALLIAAETGTTVVAELAEAPVSPVAAGLLAAGLLGKSAQFPLHFWLPRAMVAPTPVSAYLHSAALVAAGVFVLLRISPLLAEAHLVRDALFVVGVASIATGGALALVSDELKRVLAYSTIAQYGYATVLIGIGGAEALTGAIFFLVAHGLCKCALFMTAGAIARATGAETLTAARGALRTMPALAAGSAVAALGLAGSPLTMGYFKDELFFAGALHFGPGAAVIAAAAAAVTLAYTARFWILLWMGGPARTRTQPAALLTAPILLLGIPIVFGGLWTAPLESILSEAGAVAAGAPASAHLSYTLVSPETLMAACALAAGGAMVAMRRHWEGPLARAIGAVAPRVGPAAMGDRTGAAAAWASDGLHTLELRDLRDRIKAVVVPTTAFVLLGLIAYGSLPGDLDPPRIRDGPLVAALGMVMVAAVVAARAKSHLSLVLLLSFVGFGLALVFALSGAPDVALVIALIETALTLLFLAFLRGVDPETRAGGGASARPARPGGAASAAWWRRFPLAGVIAGAGGALVAMVALRTPSESIVATSHLELAELAHAKDVVTVILADFRGLDTAGEISVLAVAVMGAVAIAWGREND